MNDPRYAKLANLLVQHSTRLKAGDNVLVEATHIPSAMIGALTEAICTVGAVPTINIIDPSVTRKTLMSGTLEQLEQRCKVIGQIELERMKQMQAYISLRGAQNITELVDVCPKRTAIYEEHVQKPVQFEQRVKHTRWVVLRWPNPSFAQQANMSTEAFEDYYFKVCLTDYAKMEQAVQPLLALMKSTDQVRIVGPDTDLAFSIKNIGAIPCFGLRNVPDGECYSAPVRDSVNGTIHFNTPTIYRGIPMDNVCLEFKDGKVVKATSSDTASLNSILDSDEGARYLGEFALGFNPNVTKPMRDILFDEKIRGSLHLALGRCYDAASNGNVSSIHWDNVFMQETGGEIWFDGKLIRQNGRFLPENLQGLNPENLGEL